MAITKPPIESLLPYLKERIPGCGISDSELAELRSIYPQVSYKELRRVYYEAINKKAMQPISYIVRQLQVIKPKQNDPFHLNPQARYNARGLRVETGTDWKAKEAQLKAERERKRQAYDQVYGVGAYDTKQAEITADLKKKFSKLTNK